ncbi:MFS transporter [Paraburkholderia madseniana]|uniref:MFS transporter n=1 Tax=Paraburkholderia madseniana TaxID=2599607 RepID=A0A6N6W5X4_9BURK|nr:MFS transporter [Paraburkholderia madseniana]KAE8754960.1 MFS transporter [Paraburkholderia madseniana]
MQQKSARLRRIQWIAITFLMLAGVVNYLDRSTLSIANHSVSHELGLNAAQMGMLLSAFSFAYALVQLPTGVLLDRFGARIMLGLGMFLWSLAQFAGGFVNTLQQFLVARVCLGVGEAPQFPAGAKVVSEWFALRERGRPTGIFIASSTIGPGLAPPILTMLMLAFGWRSMFAIMGGLGIAVALAWYGIYRNRAEISLTRDEVAHLEEGDVTAEQESKLTFAEWRRVFAYPITWGMIFGYSGVIYMIWLFLTWLPAYLEHERHLSIANTGWVVAIPYLFGTVGMVGSGFVCDGLLRRGASAITSRKWPICVGMVGAALFTVPAAYTPNLPLAIAFISSAMVCLNLASGAAWSLVSVIVPRRLVASMGSIQNFGGYIGGSFAPVITGLIVDHTGSFVNAFLVSAFLALGSALIYLVFVRGEFGEYDVVEKPVAAA